jgi:hypothetical protein
MAKLTPFVGCTVDRLFVSCKLASSMFGLATKLKDNLCMMYD